MIWYRNSDASHDWYPTGCVHASDDPVINLNIQQCRLFRFCCPLVFPGRQASLNFSFCMSGGYMHD